MTYDIEVTFDLDEATDNGDGTYTITVDPNDYDLVSADDARDNAEEYIDADEYIGNLDDDTLLEELHKRNVTYNKETGVEYIRNEIELSKNKARSIITDMLGLSHLATIEDITERVKQLMF